MAIAIRKDAAQTSLRKLVDRYLEEGRTYVKMIKMWTGIYHLLRSCIGGGGSTKWFRTLPYARPSKSSSYLRDRRINIEDLN
jgi:hypothetical protein